MSDPSSKPLTARELAAWDGLRERLAEILFDIDDPEIRAEAEKDVRLQKISGRMSTLINQSSDSRVDELAGYRLVTRPIGTNHYFQLVELSDNGSKAYRLLHTRFVEAENQLEISQYEWNGSTGEFTYVLADADEFGRSDAPVIERYLVPMDENFIETANRLIDIFET